MITATEASMSSGKTYKIVENALKKANDGKVVLVLVQNHANAEEAITMIRSQDLLCDTSLVVHMHGKMSDTVLEERCNKKGCSSCRIYKETLKDDFMTPEFYQGKIFDLATLKAEAQKLGTCPYALGLALSRVGSSVVVIAPIAYLPYNSNRRYLTGIQPDIIFIDEGDTVIDLLIATNSKEMALMEARDSKVCKLEECSGDCGRCNLQFMVLDNHYLQVPHGKINDYAPSINVSTDILKTIAEDLKVDIQYGKIRDNVFILDNILENIDVINKALSVKDEKITPYQYLDMLSQPEGIVKFVSRYKADETEESTAFGIKLVLKPVLTEEGKVLLEDVDELVDEAESRKIESNIVLDEKYKIPKHIKQFIRLIDFMHSCGPDILIVGEKAKEVGDKPCRLRMVGINQPNYKATVDFLNQRNSIFLSGTFLDQKMLETFLPGAELKYINCSTPIHKEVIILFHNSKYRSKRTKADDTELTVARAISKLELINFYKNLSDCSDQLSILQFATNKREANLFYDVLKKDSGIADKFKIERHQSDGTTLVTASSRREKTDTSEEPNNTIAIDVLRSSSARGINRDYYNLCVVHGNGYAEWGSYYALQDFLCKYNPDITFEELIKYNRDRTVLQALMRAPRSDKKTVCLYLGDMNILDVPEDLKHRAMYTNKLFDIVGAMEEKAQMEVIISFIRAFLRGETITLSKTSNVQEEAENEFTALEKFILNKWVETTGKTKHKTTNTNTIKRLRHIKELLKTSGYIQPNKDKIGERPSWTKFLEHLDAMGYLVKSGKNYVRGQNS